MTSIAPQPVPCPALAGRPGQPSAAQNDVRVYLTPFASPFANCWNVVHCAYVISGLGKAEALALAAQLMAGTCPHGDYRCVPHDPCCLECPQASAEAWADVAP